MSCRSIYYLIDQLIETARVQTSDKIQRRARNNYFLVAQPGHAPYLYLDGLSLWDPPILPS